MLIPYLNIIIIIPFSFYNQRKFIPKSLCIQHNTLQNPRCFAFTKRRSTVRARHTVSPSPKFGHTAHTLSYRRAHYSLARFIYRGAINLRARARACTNGCCSFARACARYPLWRQPVADLSAPGVTARSLAILFRNPARFLCSAVHTHTRLSLPPSCRRRRSVRARDYARSMTLLFAVVTRAPRPSYNCNETGDRESGVERDRERERRKE